MTHDGYGSFGAHAAHYGMARREFPNDIFVYLKKRCRQRATVLDIGCGTGIPSRQLADHGFKVTGSDRDKRMIEQAKDDSKKDAVGYITAPSGALPFGNASFEIITAFSAFHWFCDDEASISEIKRVLKDAGLLFIVNKNETGAMKKIIKSTLERFASDALPKDAKAAYKPVQILKENGFSDIEEYTVPVVEKYTVDEAILYAQSMSVWNLIERNRHPETLSALRNVFISNAKEGFVLRPLNVTAVSGFYSLRNACCLRPGHYSGTVPE